MSNLVTEKGVVIKADASTAWIKTVRKSACAGCSSRDSCEGGKISEVEALNEAGAKVGDAVVIGFETGSLLKVTTLLYLFPVFALTAGAIIGSHLAPGYGMNESTLSAIFAFSFLFMAFGCIRFISGKMSATEKYQARVIKRINAEALETGESCSKKA